MEQFISKDSYSLETSLSKSSVPTVTLELFLCMEYNWSVPTDNDRYPPSFVQTTGSLHSNLIVLAKRTAA